MSERNTPAAADWHHAFAALPLETPPGDGWQRVAAGLARPPRPRRRVLPWAVAAATACLAALPVLGLLRAPAPPAPDAVAGIDSRTAAPDATTGHSAAAVLPVTDTAPRNEPPAPVASSAAPPAPDAVPATRPPMEPLYAESARLEALLAQLSGPEPGDGVQLALSASLRSQVSAIDEALAGNALDEPALAGLWQQRVDVLRELASLAAGQRWNALYGGGDTDYALVQVY
ncbi:hypothetical protein [Pseudoxanthomonas suwonensis]|uniref:Transmembrane protein n=1 Tax=Pseudoxanthomonas suwonensis TaxID=314722 RepID=A0A0E3Z0I6_9GAMM|nr:hypothetical protein [Pseudoxanthomonas suwonensis]AKC86153.1 hypothetical protein WQ53_04555 [Pseudoxanthomonas suwonensis]